ncbi:MAG: transglutaminase domain-containing protein [Bdellovibrionales bacterium]|nr:transglutaminase domain-containing protein [Bdellovibrionales bacterium]
MQRKRDRFYFRLKKPISFFCLFLLYNFLGSSVHAQQTSPQEEILYVRAGVMNASVVNLDKPYFKTPKIPVHFNLITVSVPIVNYLSDLSFSLPEDLLRPQSPRFINGESDINPNETPFLLAKPKRFILSDGTLWKPFVVVDTSSDSPLSQRIEKIIAKTFEPISKDEITHQLSLDQILEKIIEHLPGFIRYQDSPLKANALELMEEGILSLMSPERQKQNEKIRQQTFALALKDFKTTGEIKNSLWKMNAVFPAIPFEKYLDVKEGRCIHIALAASLILESLKIPHQLVMGSNIVDEKSGRGVGHSWIELPDGRIFDAAWGIVDSPGKSHPWHSDWFLFGNEKGKSFRFPYTQFNLTSF